MLASAKTGPGNRKRVYTATVLARKSMRGRRGLALLLCCALVGCRAQTPACANSSYVHVVASGGTVAAEYAAVLRVQVAWTAPSTPGKVQQLVHALAAAGYTRHKPWALAMVQAQHRLAISGVLRGVNAPNATGVQHALRAASGASGVTVLQVQAVGTTGARFTAVLEAHVLACSDMQQRLQSAERVGVLQVTASGAEHLELVVDAGAASSGACTSVLELTEAVLDCTHAPSAAPAWTSAAANITVLARTCERNATARVVATNTPTLPEAGRMTLACAQAGTAAAGTPLLVQHKSPCKSPCKSLHKAHEKSHHHAILGSLCLPQSLRDAVCQIACGGLRDRVRPAEHHRA